MTAAVAANKTQTAALRRKAAAADAAYAAAAEAGEEDARAGRPPDPGFGMDEDAYRAGYDSVKRSRTRSTGSKRSGSSSTSSKKRSTSSKRSGSTSSKKRSAGRRPARRVQSRASRAVTAPVETQLVNGMTAIGAMFGLAVLYNFLRNADAAAGVINSAAKAVRWLDSTKSIPYGGQ